MMRYTRYYAVFSGLVAALFILTVWNINSGSVHISLGDVFSTIFLGGGDAKMRGIIWKIRMPRMITSGVLGGALALSGFLMQAFFGNPIAGPYILGVSAGSKLCVAISMIVALRYFAGFSALAMVGAAFAGALVAMGFVLIAARYIRQMSMLLVTGIMISYICSAITDFLVTFASDSDIVNLHNWSKGSFASMDWGDVWMSLIIVMTVFLLVFLLSKPIGAYQMGEAYAQSMGVDVRSFRVLLILLASLLAGCVTAFAGPISFVGVAVPHLIKLLLRTSKPIIVIPASFLGGAVFCMFCDYIARTAFAPVELSISTVTALFGAPVVIAMMLRQQRGKA